MENCAALAHMTTGDKRAVLEQLLGSGTEEKRNALSAAFSAVDRNGWVRGTDPNPNGDFSQFTRLRVTKDRRSNALTVTNNPVDLSTSPFKEFCPCYERFMQAFGITESQCNDYIRAIQGL